LTRLRRPRPRLRRGALRRLHVRAAVPFSVGRVPSRAGAAASAIRTPALLPLRLPLLPGPLRRGRRSSLLCPRITVAKHGHVRVPAGHRAEHQGGARTVAGRHVAGPVRAGERQLLLACKKELPFAGTYWACNVSTCNRPRTALVFCSVPCWDAHVPMLRHRDAWAEERRSPTAAEWAREQREAERKERRRAD